MRPLYDRERRLRCDAGRTRGIHMDLVERILDWLRRIGIAFGFPGGRM